MSSAVVPSGRAALRRSVLPAVILLLLCTSAGVCTAQALRPRGGDSQQSATDAGAVGLPATSSGQPYSLPKVLLALGVVIGLIFALKYGAKYVMPGAVNHIGGKPKAISVVSRLAIAPKQQLMLVKVGRRVVLVGNSGGQMNALCEIDDPDEVARLIGQVESEKTAPAPLAGAFGSLFRREEDRFEPVQQDVAAGEAVEDDEMRIPARGADDVESVGAARQELLGLAERVRTLSKNFHRT